MTEYQLCKRLNDILDKLEQSNQERISGSDGLKYSEEDALQAERRAIREKLIQLWTSK